MVQGIRKGLLERLKLSRDLRRSWLEKKGSEERKKNANLNFREKRSLYKGPKPERNVNLHISLVVQGYF